jgi:tetratricopeptide (TPR) repeat protein
MAATSDVSSKNLDQLTPMFMYSQILKEILLSIKFEQKDIEKFIEYCRVAFDGNEEELKNINKWAQTYHDKTPIWWYTSDSYLRSMFDRALQMMDMNLIIKLGFYIRDLHLQIEQMHSQQSKHRNAMNVFTVYRGQGIEKTDFEDLKKGGLTSFNKFLRTNKDRNFSLDFARDAMNNPDLVGVLYVMTIDPAVATTPFASINDVSSQQGAKDEVLFSMHTVFRIHNIKPLDATNRLFQVDMTLTSDNDRQLLILTDRIREETSPDAEGRYRLGALLQKMGQFDSAQQVYGDLLERAKDDAEKQSIYNQLGMAKDNQGDYEEAIIFYEKALKIAQKSLPPNHPDLATCYNNIGGVYGNMGEYPKALSSYEKALEIQQKSLPPDHPALATSYNNIGGVCDNMGNYQKALSFYEKAFEIQKKSLPPTHPALAESYGNIGTVCSKMNEHSKALSFYEKALEIQQKSLPPHHPVLATSYNNIGEVYDNMGNYPKALSFYERAVEIAQIALPPNHPDLQKWQKNLEDAKKKV